MVKPGGKFSSLFDKTEEEWNEFGKSLSSYVKIFQDNGINLGYHNHSFEFNPLPSGKMPIECILDHNEDLKFEIDLGWVPLLGMLILFFGLKNMLLKL